MTDDLPPALHWSDPNSDPMGDLKKWANAFRSAPPSRYPVKVEVTERTGQALYAARSDAQRDKAVSGLAWVGLGAVNIPIFTVDDVPDGKARVTYSDGSVEMLPR